MTDPDSSSPNSPDRSWNVHTCASCGGRFKTAHDATASELACPHCGAALPPEAPDPPLPESDPNLILKPGADQGSRSSHRRSKKKSEPAWDRDPADGSRRSPSGGSGVDDGGTIEYLAGDPSDPDSLRIKRVRRKKHATGSQKIGRALALGTIAIVVLATAIAISLLLKKQVEVVVSEAKAHRQLPEKVAQLVAEALAARNDSAILTKAEEEACVSIINGFYAAESLEEKLAFVRIPERVKPMIERVRAENPDADKNLRVSEIVLSQKLVDKERRFITIAATVEGSDAEYRLFALEQLDDTIRMDWEVSSGYQTVPIREFIENRISEPTAFRAKVALSDYYSGHFEDRERYQSVALTYPGREEFKLAGFIDRRNLWADALLARLEFEAPSMIVTLRFPPNSASGFEVEVTGVVLDSWFY